MSSSNHNHHKNKFTRLLPDTGKRVVFIRYADTKPNRAVGGDDFEDDGEEGEVCIAAVEGTAFKDGNEKDSKDDEPDVVGELLFDVFLVGGKGLDTCI